MYKVPSGLSPIPDFVELDTRINVAPPKLGAWFAETYGFESVEAACVYLLFHSVDVPVNDKGEQRMVHWVPGGRWDRATARGPLMHHDVMVVGKMPAHDDIVKQCNLSGATGKFLRQMCDKVGLETENWYTANVLRFIPPDGGKSIKQEYLKECAWFLKHEIAMIKPKFLLLLGADAVKAVCGRTMTLSKMRSHYFYYRDGSEVGVPPSLMADANPYVADLGIKVLATIHPAFVMKEWGHYEGFVRDLDLFNRWVKGQPMAGVDLSTCDYRYCKTLDGVTQVVNELLASEYKEFSLDCEWCGPDYRSGQLRTIQFGWKEGSAAVFVMADKDGAFDAPDYMAKLHEIKRLLGKPGLKLIGHNMRADAKWLEYRGLHVMDKFTFDTMLADHMLNENAEHGLEACTTRYTNMGRYDLEVTRWLESQKLTSKHVKAHGYRGIPDEVLLPYAACDADATWRVAQVLRQRLRKEPGLNWCFENIVMPTNHPIHEIETTGFLIDTDRMQELTQTFSWRKKALLEAVRDKLSMPDFNPRSPKQVGKLLFGQVPDGFGLEPYKTTGKPARMWVDLLPEERRRHTPSTDAETLEALADAHPVVSLLHDFKVIDQVTKSFLKEAEEDEETAQEVYTGGLMAELDDDGRIRTSISQMSETGRWKSSRPNLQNLPKKQDKEISRIMGDVETIRSCFIASPGCVLVEADYKSAEVYTLGYLANCPKLIKDAGSDLHARGAVTRFGARKWDGFDEGRAPPPEWLKEFKALRVASKTVTFG